MSGNGPNRNEDTGLFDPAVAFARTGVAAFPGMELGTAGPSPEGLTLAALVAGAVEAEPTETERNPRQITTSPMIEP